MWHSAYCMFHEEKGSFISSGVVYMNMQLKMQSKKAGSKDLLPQLK